MDGRAFRQRAVGWLRWSAVGLITALLFTTVHAFYEVKFHRSTGEASWLWTWNWISRQKPVVFFVARNFALSGDDRWVRINVVGDPMYTLFFNEVEVGGGRWEGSESVDVYDVSDLAIAGTNRVVIAVRAPDGVGGVLASVDVGPLRRNIVVTDEDWTITQDWSSTLLREDRAGARDLPPQILGRPPFGRWDFPPKVERERYEAGGYVLHPLREFRTKVPLRKIAVRGGIAIAGREEIEARVFDFGEVTGRPRVAVESEEMRVIRYRTVGALAHLDDEADPFALVVAPGELTVTEPAPRSFRYFVALDPIESVEVLSDVP